MGQIKIAIDGPAGSGKSTIAKEIAKMLDILYLDTGAMYRAVTYKLMQNKVPFDNISGVQDVLNSTTIDFCDKKVLLDGNDVSDDIRMPVINENVSKVASIKIVRERLVKLQQDIGNSKSIIMDGRDIGTKVLPDAPFKFYLTATVEERANRRFKELNDKGIDINFDDIKAEIENRDKVDSEREESPLVQAEDAILIDTTGLTIKEVIDEILSRINN